MRLLYLSQYFPPEMGAPSARVSELARLWSEAGHEVTILTAFPHHPRGVKPPRYRWLWWKREQQGRVRVLRCYVWATPNRGMKRIASYLSFAFSSLLLGAALAPRPDVLIATSPQLFAGFSGYLLSLALDCPFVFEVRDLWPRGIVEVGAMKAGPAVRMLEKMELFLYRHADHVVVVTQGMKGDLVARGVAAEKITVVYNGADETAPPVEGQLPPEAGDWENRFVVVYAGTHGMTQGLTVALDAALRLRDDLRVLFVLVGEGAEKDALMAEARRRRLENVRFLPEQSRGCTRELLQLSSAVLVPLRKLPLFEITIPSKLFEAMQSGKPVLLGVEGEARRIAEEAGCGVVFEPENGEALADAVRYLASHPEEASDMGRRGAEDARRRWSRRAQADGYANLLQRVA